MQIFSKNPVSRFPTFFYYFMADQKICPSFWKQMSISKSEENQTTNDAVRMLIHTYIRVYKVF